MAKLVSNDTAERLVHLLNSQGMRGVGKPLDPRDQDQGKVIPKRFYVTISDAAAGKVKVTVAEWKRNSRSMVLPGTGTFEITGLTTPSSTYFIYLKLTSLTNDPAVYPAAVTAEAATTEPLDNYGEHIYFTIATVTTDGSGVLGQLTQRHLGDIDDTAVVTDSDSSFDASGDKRYYSQQWSPRSGRHYKTLQDYGWHDASDTAPSQTNGDYILFRQSIGSGATKYFIKKYCSPNTLVNSVTDWSGTGIIAYINSTPLIDHTNLDFSGPTAPMGTGKSGENTDQDDTYHHVYTVTNAFIDTKSWRTTGNYWMASLHLSANGTTDTFAATPNSITTLGKLDMTIAATSAWTVTGDLTASADNSNIFPRVHNAGLLQIGSSSYVWANVFSYFKTYMNLNGMTTGTMVFSSLAGFDVNGDSGKTISGWTTLGVLTGTAIIEINQGDLRTTDKILVRR